MVFTIHRNVSPCKGRDRYARRLAASRNDDVRDGNHELGLLIMVVLAAGCIGRFPQLVRQSLSPVKTFDSDLSLVGGEVADLDVGSCRSFGNPVDWDGFIEFSSASFMSESESLKEMTSIFKTHGESGFLIPLALMIGLTPAICEELLFRGYMQTRLVKSFGASAGIFVSSALFALLHMDFVHVIAVFPLGLFLGWVTWRSGSLFPAILGHFVNNSISVVLAVHASENDPTQIPAPALAFVAAILALGAAGFAATCYAAVSYRPVERTPIA